MRRPLCIAAGMSLIVIGLALVLTSPPAQAVSLTDAPGKWGREITLESDLLRVVIVADSGGRIRSLLDKRNDIDVISWLESNVAEAGSLDDRAQATTEPYAVEILDRGPKRAAVKLSWRNPWQKVTYTKTLSLVDRRPLVSVHYHLNNENAEPLAHMVKCHFLANGKKATDDWFYHMPTRSGYHRIGHNEIRKTLSDIYFSDWMGRWFGLIDEETTQGVSIAHRDGAKVQYHYVWVHSPLYPTYEWTYHPIEKEGEFSFDIVLTRELTGLTDLAHDYAVNVEKQIDGRSAAFRLQFQPLRYYDLTEIPIIQSEIRTIDGAVVANLPEQRFGGRLPEGSVHSLEFDWQATSDGSFILVQRVISGTATLGEYELPFVINKPTGQYARGAKLEETVESTSSSLVRISNDDLERGWMVSLARSNDDSPALERLRLDMGQEEHGAVGLAVTALSDLGEVTVSLAPFAEGEHDDQIAIRPHHLNEHKLLPLQSVQMPAGSHEQIWLLNQTLGAKPGTYRSRLRFESTQQGSIEIPLVVEVWPVTIPMERPAQFHCWYNLEQILYASAAVAKQPSERNVEIWRAYARDLQRAGMTGFGTVAEGRLMVKVVPGVTGEDGYPVLDFSAYDPFVQIAVEHGMDRIQNGLGPEYTLLPTERQQDRKYTHGFRASYARQWLEYGKKHGLNTMWAMYIDEAPVKLKDDHLAWIKAMRQAVPGIIGHAALSPISQQQLLSIDPYVERWTPSGGNLETFLEWTRSGEVVLEEPEQVGFYTGAVAGWKSLSYTTGRSGGWRAVAHGIRRYCFWGYFSHLTEYGWGVFPGPDGPIASVGWEGVVESNQDFCYAIMLKDGLEQARRAGIAEKKLAPIQTLYDSLVGEEQDSILRLKRFRSQGASWTGIEADESDYRLAHRYLLKALSELVELTGK